MEKCKSGYYWCYTDKKCKKIPVGWHVGRGGIIEKDEDCLLYTSPSPRDATLSRMPSSA